MRQLSLILITWGLLFSLAVYSATTSSPTHAPTSSSTSPAKKQTVAENKPSHWFKIYGGKGDDYASSIARALDGGYFIGGNDWEDISAPFGSANRRGAVVRKIDQHGALVWQKKIPVDATLGYVAARLKIR